MRINFEPRLCMILETVELLYAFVNHIPAQELTGDGPYCIPGWNLQQIMNDCCSGLSAQESILQYYFGRVPIQDESDKSTCLARNVAYDTLHFSCKTLEEAGEALRQSWRITRSQRLRPCRISEYGMVYSAPQESEYTPIASYMERLPVPPAYQQKLLETFAGYDNSVDELIALIAPVARKLEQHLSPWMEQAAPLIEQWQECLYRPDIREYIQKRFRVSAESEYDTVSTCLHFLNSDRFMGHVEDDRSLRLYVGVGLPIYPEEKQELEAWEYKALRLLGSPARVRMFQATIDNPMTSREIAQALDMHLGAVSRDVANLFDAKLLMMMNTGGKNRFYANVDAFDELLKHMASLRMK